MAGAQDVIRRRRRTQSLAARSAAGGGGSFAPAVVMAPQTLIPRIGNFEQLQAQLNAIIGVLYSLSTYGTSLPDPNGMLDGSMFVLAPANTIYQLRSGTWYGPL